MISHSFNSLWPPASSSSTPNDSCSPTPAPLPTATRPWCVVCLPSFHHCGLPDPRPGQESLHNYGLPDPRLGLRQNPYCVVVVHRRAWCAFSLPNPGFATYGLPDPRPGLRGNPYCVVVVRRVPSPFQSQESLDTASQTHAPASAGTLIASWWCVVVRRAPSSFQTRESLITYGLPDPRPGLRGNPYCVVVVRRRASCAFSLPNPGIANYIWPPRPTPRPPREPLLRRAWCVVVRRVPSPFHTQESLDTASQTHAPAFAGTLFASWWCVVVRRVPSPFHTRESLITHGLPDPRPGLRGKP